jgi:hypothetical protein
VSVQRFVLKKFLRLLNFSFVIFDFARCLDDFKSLEVLCNVMERGNRGIARR